MEDLDQGQTLRSFAPGTKVFGRYTLRRILGRGGMGVVWLARDEDLDRDVALKFLPEVVALDPASVAELKRETRRNLELTHPHIVRIYDFVQDARSAAISMEYVDGTSLSTLRLERPQSVFPLAEVERLFGQLADGLAYAHEKARIVHRDLKPANLMVNGRGELKITDFGIATSIADSVSRVSGQGSSGTAVYMSPQQMMGEKPAVTDDIYALGATLFELLTGKPPFYTGNVILQVQNKVPPTVAARREELGVTNADPVPPAWEQAIAACLAKEPSARPASVRALQAMLRGEAPAKPSPAPAPVAAAAPVTKIPASVAPTVRPASDHSSKPRRLGPLIGVIGLALAAAAVFALVWFNPERGPAKLPEAESKAIAPKEPAVVERRDEPIVEKAAVEPPRPAREEPKVVTEPAKPLPASLRLAVEPADAVIRVGEKTYSAPLHLPDLPAGPIELVVSREGFRERRLQFDLAAGQSLEAPLVRLEELLTPVTLAGRQSGLTYTLIGPQERRYSGTLPDRLELPRGRYTATISRPGYGEKQEVLSVGASPLEFTADLPGARLEITSEPAGATVRSGERVLGPTPLRLEDQPTGPLPLTLSAEHFDPLEVTADLVAGNTWTRQLKLTPDATSLALQSIDGYWIPTGMLGALSDSAVFISAAQRSLVMPGKALWRKAVLEATAEKFDAQAGGVVFKGSTKDWEGTFFMGREGEELLYWFPTNPKQKWRFKRGTEEEYRKILKSVTGR